MATLVGLADFVYCSEDAYFLTPFMTANLAPEGLSTNKFQEIMGRRKASEMLLADERLYAKDALKRKFVNGIIPNSQLPNTEPIITDIDKLPNLRRILEIDPETIQRQKKIIL